MKWKIYGEVQRPKKRVSSREEGLGSLLESEWTGAESQRGMMQRMRRVTKRQTKDIEKESISILFDATLCINFFFFFFSFSGKDL